MHFAYHFYKEMFFLSESMIVKNQWVFNKVISTLSIGSEVSWELGVPVQT